MRPLRRFFHRLNSCTRRRGGEDRLRAEIEEHLALQTAENMRAGLSPIEARRQAALKFGPVEAMSETYREQRGLPFVETLLRDIMHTLRSLRMAPAFMLATVLTLALGIGATTSMFTLVHAVLLKSLPVARPAELYRLGKESRCCFYAGYSQDKEFSLVSYDLYKYLRDNTRGFSDLAAFPAQESLFGGRRAGASEAARSYPGEFVSGNYFRMFGLGAYTGRVLTPEDDRPGAPPAAVMSYRLWQQRCGADPAIVGSTFNLNDKPFTVVGIAPPGFFGDTLRSAPPDFFLPLNTEPCVQVDADLNKYDTHWLDLIGRVKPGTAPGAVEAEMRAALKQWLRSHWGETSANDRAMFESQTLFLRPGGAGIGSLRDQYERWLRILTIVSGFVLLIVCANVANLMLVRGMERRRQTSLSMALGARSSRVVRRAVTESILLSLLGGAAGLAVAFATTRLILRFAFPVAPGFAAIPIDASPSLPVLLFALIVSLLTGIAFGAVPAWMAARVNPIEALRGAGRSSSLAASHPKKTLVVLQSALALVLLSAAGLLTAALQTLEHQDLGFAQEWRIVATMNPRLAGYRAEQLPLLYRRIHDSISGIPAVASVALCLYAPQNGGWGTGVWVNGHRPPGPNDDNLAGWDRATAGYFDVIGTPITRGRGITAYDTAASRPVAVINEAFARKFFRNEDPIGRHFGRMPGASAQLEVVGVSKDARYLSDSPGKPVAAFFVVPEAQADYTQHNLGALFLKDIVILIKPGAGAPFEQIRKAMGSVDPNLPLVSLRPLSELVAVQFTQQRLIARLTSFFGILSLVLASIGLYGVTAHNAGRRTNEIGVRVALGADRGNIIRLVLRSAFGLTCAGLLIGLPLALAAGRLLGNQLYGMSPYNPAVTLSVVAVLGLSALLASLIPALRASRISPLDALRAE